MKYVQAIIALGLFGWLGYATFTNSLPGGDGGSSKTRALKNAITGATDHFGVTNTSLALAGFGVLLAAFFLMRRTE